MTLKTHSRLPSSQDFDHLVYLRIFEGCNLHCDHCFIPSNPRRMSIDDIRRVPELLSGRIPEGARILVQWHGGEPTLFGPDFIRAGIESLSREGPQYIWRHGIQTNLMTYDEAWRDLFREHFGGEVGISWDPVIRRLNRHAHDSHAKFDARFRDKLHRLVSDGLSPFLVVTATRVLFESFSNPLEFFSFWRNRGVRHIHLERITRVGHARPNWSWLGLSNREYSDHMSRWYRAYRLFRRQPGNHDFFVSPFDNLSDSILSLDDARPRAHGCWSGKCDMTFHTIDGDGYKPGCTALTSETPSTPLDASVRGSSEFSARRAARTHDCASCPFRPICSSGCLAIDFDDGSNECSGARRFLECIRQTMTLERNTTGHETLA